MTLWTLVVGGCLLVAAIGFVWNELRNGPEFPYAPSHDGPEAWSSEVAGLGTELQAFGAATCADATLPMVEAAGPPDEIFALLGDIRDNPFRPVPVDRDPLLAMG